MKLSMLVLLVLSFAGAFAQSTDQSEDKSIGVKEQLKIEKGKNVYMLTYFRQRYPTRIEIDAKGNTVEIPLPDPILIAKLHIALSTDGRHWTPLNDNKPVWEQFMRDPFIHRGPDGLWRILSTGGGGGDYDREKSGPPCLYATSKDLIHWQLEGVLPLMKNIRNDSGAPAGNIWAPEWFYDKKTKEYLLFWSSSFKDAGWKESRLWYCKTRDWKTFTSAKELFHPTYSSIDGTLQEYKGTYYLFHKEEEFGAKTGERRAIRVATSKRLEGAYTVVEGQMNNGQIAPVITEGPTVMKDPVKPGWLLLYDFPMANDFGASYSPDLIHWTVEKNGSFPPDARHGSVSLLTADEAKALISTYSGKN